MRLRSTHAHDRRVAPTSFADGDGAAMLFPKFPICIYTTAPDSITYAVLLMLCCCANKAKHYDLLFGLANIAYIHTLPKRIA